MSRKRLIAGVVAFGAVASVAYAAFGVFESSPEDKWAELEAFKAGLPTLLVDSQGDPAKFNLVELGNQLGSIRVDGMQVCAHEEISADQYVKLSAIAESLSGKPGASRQLRTLLESSSSATDCQFRVLEASTGIH